MPKKPRMLIRLNTRFALATALSAAFAVAQEPIQFTTPDGSRFWLIAGDGPPIVHWAIASPCGVAVDPPTVPGLALACVISSLRGTWHIGSLDEAREAATLAELDQAECDLAIAPQVNGVPPKALAERVAALSAKAELTSDPQTFRRAMLSAPASDIQVTTEGNAAVLSLSTTPAGTLAIAKLLVDRREGQALRSVRAIFEAGRSAATAAFDQDPFAPMRAEALALAYSGAATARLGERPPNGGFSRALAQSVFARTQHPTQTVHVLTGNFDVFVIRKTLENAFVSTALPLPTVVTKAQPRTGTIMRRAVLPGAPHPMAVLAWPLRGNEPPDALACVVRWFADGKDSWLGRELQRLGHQQIQLRVLAPWPAPPDTGMLMIEASDPFNGAPDLAAQILKLSQAATQKVPREGELALAYASWYADWQRANSGAASNARYLAANLLSLPFGTAKARPPADLGYEPLPAMLQQLLDSTPVVVEWKNP